MNRLIKHFALVFCVLLTSCAVLFKKKPQTFVESAISNLTQITSDRESAESFPAWSKDGSKIVFTSNRSGYWELWVLPIKGGGMQQITSGAVDLGPHFSPDGNEIVFESSRITGVWNIWKVSLNTRGLTQLTNSTRACVSAKWSPDGSKIAYAAVDKDDIAFIWVIGSNGENPTQLARGIEPAWSPDGKKIAFSRFTVKDWDIWVMNADGTGLEQLTRTPEKHERMPAWSCDGKTQAYVVQFQPGYFHKKDENGKVEVTKDTRTEIWMMDILGRNPTQLTAFRGLNHTPTWSPDGKIAFVSNRGDSWDIWSMVPVARP